MITYLKTKLRPNLTELARDIFVFALSPIMLPLGFFLWVKDVMRKGVKNDKQQTLER